MASRHLSPWRTPPPVPPVRQTLPAVPENPPACVERLVRELSHDTDGRLTLLNRTRPVVKWRGPLADDTGSAGDWDWGLGEPSRNRLWTITLHYHHWLCHLAGYGFGAATSTSDENGNGHASHPGDSVEARGVARGLFRSALRSWLDRCPLPVARNTLAWNSYAIATRMGCSVQTWHMLQKCNELWPPSFGQLLDRWRESLFLQARHLHQHIEWDLRANHLLRDAVGLAWAGRFFSGTPAQQWLDTAQQIAVSQAEEQMLPDGGHFERSPFYHLEVMDDWLTLAALLPDSGDLLRATWRRAAEFATWMTHPDGHVANFSDGARARSAPHLNLGSPSNSLPKPAGARHFSDAGFIVWRRAPWDLYFDVGPVGPNIQPGHGHADTLSVECSLEGQLLFADPGSFDYDLGDDRRYDRSTAAHNTVCIDGKDSSEMWHIFRVGRRARPRDVSVQFRDDGFLAAATHDGYRHLPGAPTHRRSVAVDKNGALRITDRVDGGAAHHVCGGWLLAPGWNLRACNEGDSCESGGYTSFAQRPSVWHLTCEALGTVASARLEVRANRPVETTLADARYSPDYHIRVPAARLQWEYAGTLPLEVECIVTPCPSSGEGGPCTFC